MKKILVIEDDADIRTLLRAALGFRGYTVVTCANGREGIATFSEQGCAFGLIIVDLMMPVMNGWEFMEALEGVEIRSASGKMPVVVMSGMGKSEIAVGLKPEVEFLRKPIQLPDLFATVERLFVSSESKDVRAEIP